MPNTVNRIIQYFDLQSNRRGAARAFSGGNNLTVIPQYIALVLGIAVQPFLADFQDTGAWNITLDPFISRIVFALIIGVSVFPGVYRKAFDPDKPRFVQFCTIFTAGIGWEALFASALKATGV